MACFEGKGIIASMVTPFNEDETINTKSLRRLINYLINKGVHGLFVNSGAGEFASLTLPEKKKLIEITVEETGGRVPVYAGTGSITTTEAIDVAQFAETAGADAVSIIPPYSVSPNPEEVYDFYKQLAGSTKLPVVLYNHPKMTGVTLTEDLVARLSRIDNIVGIKDSSGNFALTMSYIRHQNEHFSVFAGIDMYIFAALASGARGSISSTAGVVPEFAVKIYDSVVRKDFATANKVQNELYPLRKAYSMASFPAVVKESLNMMGMNVGAPRKPIMPLSEEKRTELKGILQNMGAL
jgi:4-hydroxy-tetrahydrodipicolinate synthase